MDTEFLRYKFEDGHDGVITKTKFKVGIRHVQVVYMFVCSVVMGSMRGSTGVGVLAITDVEHSTSYIEIHNWSQSIQGIILSSYFFGYALFLIPSEVYLTQLGEKFVLTSVLLINGSLAAAMPTIVNKGGWIASCNAQFLLGMTQACVTPINQKLITNWLPPHERSTFNCLVQGGLLLGTIIGLPVSGLISEARLGWELVYYSQAMMTFSMAAIWGLLTASSPDKHKAVSDEERDFIKETSKLYRKKKLKNPWRRLLKTRQFWAIAGAHASTNVIFIFFLVNIPAYLKSFHMSLFEAAFQVMLAFASLWLVYILTAPSLDWAYRIGIVDHFFNIRYFRKLVNGLGMLGLVAGLIILPKSNPADQWNVFLLMIILGSLGLQFSGFLDRDNMTQNFSGTLLVMTSAVASVVAAFVPLITGYVVFDVSDQTCWRIMYYVLSAFAIVSGVFYTAFGDSDRQFWDVGPRNKFGYTNDASNLELEEFESRI